MEWIRISQNKLKIMLSAEDTSRYALNCRDADYADALTREAFRDILNDVQGASGFDTSEDKIYIQMYPSKEGGCELFVTKMGLLLGDPEPVAKGAEAQTKRTFFKRKRSAFRFERLEHLTALCRRLHSLPFGGESEVWQDEHNGWWLLLTECEATLAEKMIGFLREYGKSYPFEDVRSYLPEHAKQICASEAVDTFARF